MGWGWEGGVKSGPPRLQQTRVAPCKRLPPKGRVALSVGVPLLAYADGLQYAAVEELIQDHSPRKKEGALGGIGFYATDVVGGSGKEDVVQLLQLAFELAGYGADKVPPTTGTPII